jgi:hypothetical protein
MTMLPLDRRRFLLGSISGLALLPHVRLARAVTPIMNLVPGLGAAGAKLALLGREAAAPVKGECPGGAVTARSEH